MNHTTSLALLALTIAAAAGCWYFLSGDSDPPGPTLERAAERTPGIQPDGAAEPPSLDPGRRALSALEVRVVGPDGAIPTGGDLRATAGETALTVDARGGGVFRVEAGRGPIGLSATGWTGHYSARAEAAPGTSELTIVLDPHFVVPVRWVGPDDTPLRRLRPSLVVVEDPSSPPAADRPLGVHVETGEGRGLLRLLERPPLYATTWVDDVRIHAVLVEGSEEELVFRFSDRDLARLRGTLAFRVVDSVDREPFGPDRLGGYLLTRAGAPPLGALLPVDANGSARVENRTAGEYDLHLRYPGFENRAIPVSVPAGGVEDLGTLELRPAAQILGTAVDSDGGVIRAEVVALDPETGTRLAVSPYLEDYMGEHFGLDGLAEGQVHLSVLAEGFAANPQPVSIAAGVNTGVRLHAVPGTAVAWTCAPGAESEVRITADELVVWRSGCAPLQRREVWLAPGTYELVLARAGEETRHAFEVHVEPIDLGTL